MGGFRTGGGLLAHQRCRLWARPTHTIYGVCVDDKPLPVVYQAPRSPCGVGHARTSISTAAPRPPGRLAGLRRRPCATRDGRRNHAAMRPASGFSSDSRTRPGCATPGINARVGARRCLHGTAWPQTFTFGRGKKAAGQGKERCNLAQSKPLPGSNLRPGATCSWPATCAIG